MSGPSLRHCTRLVFTLVSAHFLLAQPAPPIRAAGRGAPNLFLRDGETVTTAYPANFPGGLLRPASLASADFDEDGMPDLASGYATADGTGIVTLHRGNVDALWPYGKSAPPAFLPGARMFALPEAPDFLAAGDFDADGHWDLVAAHRGSQWLYLLRGDGHGGFAAAEKIALPGAVTALTAGEIDRPDGLTDIAVAVNSSAGAQVLVFESPRGALGGAPESFPLPSAVTALAILPLDDDPWNDLAVAAGNDLFQIHGRDRKQSFPKPVRESVPAPEITRQTLPFAVRAMAAGRFTSASLLDLAALGDDGKLHFLERPDAAYQAARRERTISLPGGNGQPGPVHRGTGDAQSMPPKPQTKELVVTGEVALPGPVDATAHLVTAHTSLTGADDAIVTDSRAHALHVISRQARKSSAMHLAATLEAAAAPAAVLGMRLTPGALHSLVILQSGQTEPSVVSAQTVNTFVVTNTQDPGASGGSLLNTSVAGSLRAAISNATNASGPSTITFAIPTSDPNYNSTTGTFTIRPIPNGNCGIATTGVPCAGLPPLPAGCVLDGYLNNSGASPNTLATGDNAVLNIVISGASAGQGPVGVWVTNGDTTVRGLIVTGFTQTTVDTEGGQGIAVESGSNYLEGNFVGVDSTGTMAEPNYGGVVSIFGPNVVGGTTPQARNLLSGNNYANFASADHPPPASDLLQGNYIGTDRTGTKKVGGGGVAQAGQSMVIGGTAAGAGNLIAGNIYVGITVNQGQGNDYTPDNNLIQGNLIGTDVTGTVALANEGGVALGSGNGNQIGGTASTARNVISGNGADAVSIIGIVNQTTVQGNYIGVDISGEKALPNYGNGVDQSDLNPSSTLVTSTLIGGEGAGAGNVISNNIAEGIVFGGSAGGYALGNFVGTDAAGTKAMGNGVDGVAIVQGGSNYVIGGTDSSAANTIAFNQVGVLVNPAAGNPGYAGVLGANSIVGNQIFSNQSAGVYVASGTENLVSQNSIYSNDMGIDVNSLSEFTNSNCQASTSGANNLQNAPLLTAASDGTVLVSATATDPDNNTSEFSNCAAMTLSGNTLNIAGSLNSLPGTSYTIEFFTNTACDASHYGEGQTFLNRITVTTNGSCVANFNNTANISTADLSLQLTYNPSISYPYVSPGGTFTYEEIVTNNGAAGASGVMLTDTLPAGVAFASATPNQGTCSNNSGAVTCNLGTLASGATTTVHIAVTATGVGNLTNTATVSSSTTDPNLANNSASEEISSSYASPYISQFSPASIVAGSGPLALTVYGGAFYQGVTTLTENGTNLAYTLVSGSELQVTLPSTITGAAGAIAFTVTNPAPGGGTYSATFNIYPNAGTVTQFQLTGVPNPAVTGVNYGLTVTALDYCGNVVTGYRGVVSLSDSLGYAMFTLSSYQFTAGDNGVHTFPVTFGSATNPYSDALTVTDEGTTSITGFLNTVSIEPIGPPNSFQQDTTPGNVPIGFPFQPLEVTVYDANGNTLPGVAVTFSAPTSGPSGMFPNQQASITIDSDGNGNAQTVLTANSIAGTFAVNVAATGGVTLQPPFSLTSTINVPAHLTIVQPGGLGCATPVNGVVSVPIDTQLLATLCVMVTDAQNNPVNNVPVTFTAPTSGASINLSSTSVLSGNEDPSLYPGIADLAPVGVANAIAGTYPVTVNAGTVSTAFRLVNTSPANRVAQIFFNGPFPTATASLRTPFASPLQAIPQDANGDCLANVPVTFSVPTSGPSAILSATTGISDPVTCIVQVTATANNVVGGPYNVTATAGGVSATFALTNTAGMITLTATGGTPQATLPGTAFAAPLQVMLVDQNGSPLACHINFFAPSSSASATLSASSATANSSGAAQISATANSTQGSYQVTAQFASAIATFSLENVTPGAVTATGGTPQSTLIGAAFAAPLQATVTDSGGNPIAGITVNFSNSNSSGALATLSSSTAVTNAVGVATVTASADGATGSYQVIAKVGTASAAFSLTNTAYSPCDANQQGSPDISDVQTMVNEGLGSHGPANDLNADGKVNVVDIEIVINWVLRGTCTQ